MNRLQTALLLIACLWLGGCQTATAPKETVPGSTFIFFKPSTLRDATLSAQRASFLDKDVKDILKSSSSNTTQFTVGSSQAMLVVNASESELSELKKTVEALQGTLQPNYFYKVNLPATDKNASSGPAPSKRLLPTSGTCNRRQIQTWYNEHLDLLDMHAGDGYYCSPVQSGPTMDVFVLDSGVDNGHYEFAGVEFHLYDAYQWPSRSQWTPNVDVDGHGTHVAGIIASASYGVTPNVAIHSVKVVDDSGWGTTSTIFYGLDTLEQWLLRNPSKRTVINMSIGGDRDYVIEAKLSYIARLFSDRVIFAVAAGNDNRDACDDDLPSVNEMITVGSVTRELSKSPFSNHGRCVDIFAYGDNVQSTAPQNRIKVLSGTSMATPVVTGVFAQYWLQNPSKSGWNIRNMILDQLESELHVQGMISRLYGITPNKLVRYACSGGCSSIYYTNLCLAYPCLNGGTCWNTVPSGYFCQCPYGYGGDRCERSAPRACSSYPCYNGGICYEDGYSYRCSCASGYTGSRCESRSPGCASSPCYNGGICYEDGYSYRCSCASGYTGSRCESRSPGCASSPCRNGGYCSNTYDGYQCYCPNGFTGTNCENYYRYPSCSSNPCLNGGTCTNVINGFYCSCPYGTNGDRCEKVASACSSYPCQNGGACYDQGNTYQCSCRSGYTGTRCENPPNGCSSSPCRNGGYCSNTYDGYKCYCQNGYTGTNCDAYDSCYASPCYNGGTCNGGSCKCPPAYSGVRCEKYSNRCNYNPCMNGGTCYDSGISASCACPPKYSGSYCEQQCYYTYGNTCYLWY